MKTGFFLLHKMCQLKTARISLVKDARIHMNLYFSETVIEFESLNYYIIAIIILDQEPLPGENNRHKWLQVCGDAA